MSANPQCIVIPTLGWAPEDPRGFVRDLQLRWACKEAGLSNTANTIPLDKRDAERPAP